MIAVLLVGMFFMGLIGMVINHQLRPSRALVAMLPLLVQLVTYTTFKNLKFRSTFIDLLIFAGLVLAIWVISLYLMHFNEGGNFYERKLEIETPLGRSNYLAAYLVFATALVSFRRPVLLPILVCAIFMTMSRGAVLALVFVFFSRLFVSRRNRSKLFVWALLAGTVLVIGIGLYYSNSYVRTEQSALESVYNRFYLWGFSFHELGKNALNFVLGLGPNGFRTAVEQTAGVEDVWDPHASFLIIWMNYGLVGLMLYGLFMIAGYRRIRQAVALDPRMEGVLVGIQSMIIYSLYETVIATVAFDMFFVLVVCMAIACIKRNTVSA